MRQDWHHYCITYNPSDYPGLYVVRRWAIQEGNPHPVPDKDPICAVEKLDRAREHVPPGLVCIPYQEGREDPVIVETWM
jgi:hypothetical protein